MVGKRTKNRKILRCVDCKCFNGFNPNPVNEAPAAFCSPVGETCIKPCEPYEVAFCKPCFVSKKEGS